MGIEPKLFGPYLWGAMHYIALGAPVVFDENTKVLYRNFYTSLPQLIPCNSCGTHFQEVLHTIPITDYLSGSSSLFTWTVYAHNAVNKKLNKPDISVTDAKNKWMKLSNISVNNLNSHNSHNSHDTIVQKSSKNNAYELLVKCTIILLIFGGGIYIGKFLFTKERKKN